MQAGLRYVSCDVIQARRMSNSTVYTASNGRESMNCNSVKTIKATWLSFRYNPRICIQGLGKARKMSD